MKLSDFDFQLPAELIAQEPSKSRAMSRLLVVDRQAGSLEDSIFERLGDWLRPGDLVVANQSRVLPARLYGRLASGGKIEILLIRQCPGPPDTWEIMARPSRKLKPGSKVELAEGVTATVERGGSPEPIVAQFSGTNEFKAWLNRVGKLPVPPYIKSYPSDPERYQTVYSSEEGSVAAPTAGLHFTHSLLAQLRDAGIEIQFVTLHVGPGTFRPVYEEDLDQINLEPEWGSISSETAVSVARAKSEGRRLIAVGTTTTRLLEGLYLRRGEIGPWSGEIDLFIRPPFRFRVVDALITNFHLPRSTLLMLVSALAGPELIQRAYAHAIQERYRFYSFGDAMFIR